MDNLMNQKVLIIVPHQDDEINIAGSMIYELTKQDICVNVLYTTNGDYHPYEANTRLKECILSLDVIGVAEKNIYFMGYGDTWKGETHLYNTEGDEPLISMAGRCETYGLPKHPEYRFIKSGIHSKYTRNNYKRDMRDIILDIMPTVIICVDFDWHWDHRATSLIFEEIIGELLKERNDFKPFVMKKFAYAGAWEGPKDYYDRPFKPTILPFEKLDKRYELDVPSYKWDSRIRFKVPTEAKTPLIRNNIIYKAACKHKSQMVRFTINRICNDDIVFWLRRTDSLTYHAGINVSSGNAKYLNDFKLIDCSNVYTKRKNVDIFDNCIWIPDEKDERKTITFFFAEPKIVQSISLYENFDLICHIFDAEIDFYNGYKIKTGELINSGEETIILFPEQKNITTISVKIMKYVGKKPGFTEVEIFTNKQRPNLSFLKGDYQSDKTSSLTSNRIRKTMEINYFEILLLIARIKRKIKRVYKNG
ncbi:PIG-L family deacetylase [Clostridium estertheticum]|uniref:PIG-L family deacetylase n=1 Tax=Clostridium estertheticum TaxID=238834 RepID=UPI001CF31702|nr:PIG-L family deacetylase [Clostridium estertheticum]MCB2339587.1 PIG-L family deacetylase [Clostridium estertheticum]